jgi:hypothetical protein
MATARGCRTNYACSAGTCAYLWGGTITITSAPPGAPTACVGAPVVIHLSASGPSPRDVSIPGGGCVVFQNDDTVPHWMNSDPHPVHTDCPDLNESTPIAPGQVSLPETSSA